MKSAHIHRLATTGILALSLGSLGHALIVDAVVTPVGGGYRYDYTLTNDDAVSYLQLELIAPWLTMVSTIGTPLDWIWSSYEDQGDTHFLWTSTADTADLGIGETLGGFSFVSPYAPMLGTYVAVDGSFTTVSGSVSVPSAVPEPASLAALALGGAWLSRRRRTASRTKTSSPTASSS